MATPTAGERAPDFTLPTDRGDAFSISGHAGSPIVLFFYPADDTSGCTLESIEFTRLLPDFAALGAVVVGISPDSVESHCQFRDKHGLGMPLVADTEHIAIDAYGVWGPKVTFGKETIGLRRTSFLIGPDGTVAGVFAVPKVEGHAADVLDATRALMATS